MNWLKTFVQGWWRWLFRDRAIEAMALKRRRICEACPHIDGLVCGLCGCPLPPKTRAVGATCPDGRWPV